MRIGEMNMGRLFAVFASLFVTAVFLFGQGARITADRESKDEQLLINRERQWSDAFKEVNEVALREILSETFVFTDDAGQVSDQRHYIEATKNIRVKSYTLTDITVRVYGDTGIVAGRWAGVLTIEGKDVDASFRFTDTFVKREGQWYAVASQDTKVS